MWCADGQVTVAESEDKFQITSHFYSVYKLTYTYSYRVIICTIQVKYMGKYNSNVQRVRVTLGNNVMKQMSGFKYLRYLISKYRIDMEILSVLQQNKQQ